jgi:hypothetical protein
VGTGPKKGQEVVVQTSQTYHGSWESALRKLYNLLVADDAAKNNIKIIKGLMDAQERAYQMLDAHLARIDHLPPKEPILN